MRYVILVALLALPVSSAFADEQQVAPNGQQQASQQQPAYQQGYGSSRDAMVQPVTPPADTNPQPIVPDSVKNSIMWQNF